MYKSIKRVYDSLQNDESKFVFRQKLLESLTGDYSCTKELLLYYKHSMAGKPNLLDVIADKSLLKGRSVVMFGVGGWLNIMKSFFDYVGLTANLYCDNDPTKIGTVYCGKPIISVDTLCEKYPDAIIIITTNEHEREILSQLLKLNFKRQQIVTINNENQYLLYFDGDIVDVTQKDRDNIFVDGGCYNGETSLEFIRLSKGSVKKIYAFEPDNINFVACKKCFKKNLTIPYHLENAGLYSKNDVLSFSGWHGEGARLVTDGSNQAQVVALDDVVDPNDDITFIKLDVEGAELAALKGMEQTISRCRPTLAVCLYHRPSDIWDIPLYIYEKFPFYRLYIRHYAPSILDTILYACP